MLCRLSISRLEICALLAYFLLLSSGVLRAQPETMSIASELAAVDTLRQQQAYSAAWEKLAALETREAAMTPAQAGWFYKLRSVKFLIDGNYPQAAREAYRARSTFQRVDGLAAEIEYVNTFVYTSMIDFRQGRYASALDTLLLAKQLAVAHDSLALNTLPSIYTNEANVLERSGNYYPAAEASYKALAVLAEAGQQTSRTAGIAHNTLGTIYQRLGRNRQSSEEYLRAADILAEVFGENSLWTLSALSNAATNAEVIGNFDEAIAPLVRKLTVLQQDPESDKTTLTNTYYSLGTAYRRLGEFDLAIRATVRALATWRKVTSEPHVRELNILRLLASIQLQLKDYPSAKNSLDRAQFVNSQLETQDSKEYGALLLLLGTYYTETGDVEAAVATLKEAFEVTRQTEGGFVLDVAEVQAHYINALILAQQYYTAKATIASLRSDLSRRGNTIDEPTQLTVAANLALMEVRLALHQLPQQAVPESKVLQLETATIQLLKHHMSRAGRANQRYLARRNYNPSFFLKQLAEIHLHRASLFDASAAETEILQALHFMELEQTYLRTGSLASRAHHLKPATRARLRELAQRAAAYEKLRHEQQGDHDEALVQRSLYQDSIIALEAEMLRLLPQPSIDSLFQAKLNIDELPTSFVFYTCLEGFTATFILAGAQGLLKVKRISDQARLRGQLAQFQSFVQSPSMGFGESREILQLGSQLYTELLAWLWSDDAELLPSRIAILEALPLAGLPMAALPVAEVTSLQNYRQVEFAVMRHAFSYHNGLRGLNSALQRERQDQSLDVCGLAPLSSDSLAASTEQASLLLPFATEEVTEVARLTHGQTLIGKAATAGAFFRQLASRSVVHLASHAKSNASSPEFGYVMLSDTSGDASERVYARTIGELESSAELVVLSACESGQGQPVAGFGTLSLANTFLEAGAGSVINSLWRIDDRQSQLVVFNFYQQLLEDEPLDVALAQAQRQYLQQAGSQYVHPYYWAGFSVSGSVAPLAAPWWQQHLLLLSLGILVLALLLWLTLRYFRRHAASSPPRISR